MIIDIHTHLGDILYGKDIINQKGLYDPYDSDPSSVLIQIEDGDYVWPESVTGLSPEEFTRKCAVEEPARNNAGSLENLVASMEKNNISYVCALPVVPRVTFEQLLAVHKEDSRILPFTGIDFDMGEVAYEKLIQDSENGAFGMKLHPILQKKSMLSDEVKEAMKVWEPTGKPVIVHTFKCEYYPSAEASLYSNSDFGSNHDFLKLVEMFPNVKFVAAHMGGSRYYEELLEGKDLANLYVDSSLEPAVNIRKYIDSFGKDRIMYGSDWPWGYQEPSLRALKTACQGDKGLERKILCDNGRNLLKI